MNVCTILILIWLRRECKIIPDSSYMHGKRIHVAHVKTIDCVKLLNIFKAEELPWQSSHFLGREKEDRGGNNIHRLSAYFSILLKSHWGQLTYCLVLSLSITLPQLSLLVVYLKLQKDYKKPCGKCLCVLNYVIWRLCILLNHFSNTLDNQLFVILKILRENKYLFPCFVKISGREKLFFFKEVFSFSIQKSGFRARETNDRLIDRHATHLNWKCLLFHFPLIFILKRVFRAEWIRLPPSM